MREAKRTTARKDLDTSTDLCHLYYIGNVSDDRMSKGASGRIVIEVEPTLKRRLYSTLAMDGSTLKDWFIQCAEAYLEGGRCPSPDAPPAQESKR